MRRGWVGRRAECHAPVEVRSGGLLTCSCLSFSPQTGILFFHFFPTGFYFAFVKVKEDNNKEKSSVTGLCAVGHRFEQIHHRMGMDTGSYLKTKSLRSRPYALPARYDQIMPKYD